MCYFSELQGTDLLLIDGLVEHMGAPVRLLLERDAGTGLYPPPSLHTTLLLYLAEDVPTATKQLVVAYLLFDLMHLAPEDQTTVVSLYHCLLELGTTYPGMRVFSFLTDFRFFFVS